MKKTLFLIALFGGMSLFGQKEVYEIIRKDAENKMSPIKKVIGDLLKKETHLIKLFF